jgi:hypothetical protein
MILLISIILSIIVGVIFLRYEGEDYYDYKLRDMNSGFELPERPAMIIRFVNMLQGLSSYQYYVNKGIINEK